MGALLLAGLIIGNPTEPAPQVQPVQQQVESHEVTVVHTESLELLDPVYSEKAVYQDGILRIAFDASYNTSQGYESRLPFWIHNLSGDVLNVLWDRCSLQLPGGNTVRIVNEESLTYPAAPGNTISIAPNGDLFDAAIPVSEIAWDDAGTWTVTSDVLNQGTFTFVLAVEASAESRCLPEPAAARRAGSSMRETLEDCDPRVMPQVAPVRVPVCDDRDILYYTFRFVIR